MKKTKYINILMLFCLVLLSIFLMAAADIRAKQIKDLEHQVEYLQNNINVKNKKGLYKYELVPGLQWPVHEIHSATITSDFDSLRQYFGKWSWHYAIDICRRAETYIYPARAGLVTEVKYNVFFGWTVTIEHYDSMTKYCHLEGPRVQPGDMVDTSQVIARMGNTGRWSKGQHLHFEYYKYVDGGYVVADPVARKKHPGEYWK
jgi:murein DD-endopeptidase MepM/ murein hydrolase activator NlpD